MKITLSKKQWDGLNKIAQEKVNKNDSRLSPTAIEAISVIESFATIKDIFYYHSDEFPDQDHWYIKFSPLRNNAPISIPNIAKLSSYSNGLWAYEQDTFGISVWEMNLMNR